MTTDGRSAPALLVFYDRQCGYCRWSVAQLLRADRDQRLRLIAIQSDEGQRLLAAIPAARRLDSAHLIDGDGRLLSGGAAVAPLAGALPPLAAAAPLLRALERPVNALYRLIASQRQQVGRFVSGGAQAKADQAIAAHEARFASAGSQ